MSHLGLNSGSPNWAESHAYDSPEFAKNDTYQSSSSVKQQEEEDIEMIDVSKDKTTTATDQQESLSPAQKRETRQQATNSKAKTIFSALGSSIATAAQSIKRKTNRLLDKNHHLPARAENQTKEFSLNTIEVDHTNEYASAKLNHEAIKNTASSSSDIKSHLYKHLSFEEALYVERMLQLGETGLPKALIDYHESNMAAKSITPEMVAAAKTKMERIENARPSRESSADVHIRHLTVLVEAKKEFDVLVRAQGNPGNKAELKKQKNIFSPEITEARNLSHQVSLSNINKAITLVMKDHQVNTPEDAALLKQLSKLREYSFKINQREDFREAKQKLDNLSKKIDSGETVSDSEKLSYKELKVLLSFAKFKDTLSEFAEYRTGNNKLVGEIQDTIISLEKLENQLKKESLAKPGNLIFHDLDSYQQLQVGKNDMRSWFEGTFVTDLSHAGVVNTNGDGLSVSHVWKSYENQSIGIADFTIGSIYELNVSTLISDDSTAWLAEKYGKENVHQELQKKFENISKNFHTDNKHLEGLQNSDHRQNQVAYTPHTRRNFLGVKQEKDLSSIRFEGKKEMICSEFAAKATLHCLNELKKELRDEYRDHLISQGFPPDKAAQASTHLEILNHPIPSTERLKHISPERLYRFLEPNLNLMPPPPTLSKFIKP